MWKLLTVSGGLLVATVVFWVIHQSGHYAGAQGTSKSMSPGVFPDQVMPVESFGFNTPVPKQKDTYGILNVQLTDSTKDMPLLDLTALSTPVVMRPPNPEGNFPGPTQPEEYNLLECGSSSAP